MASVSSSGLNETFDLLTHPYRRYVLYYLTQESEVVDIDTLATAIANWSRDHTGTDQTNNTNEIKTVLHHTHFPKLTDAGIITFGPNKNSIELREADGLSRFLDDTAPIDGYRKIVADD